MKRDEATVELIERAKRGDVGKQEARLLVDAYYDLQKYRIGAGNRIASGSTTAESVVGYIRGACEQIEKNVARVLDVASDLDPLSAWCKAQRGIGPIIAAGLWAYLDFTVKGERVQTASRFWSFAGLDPSKVWKSGTKRPWCGRLKTLCWKIGESFVKVKAHPEAHFAHLYEIRKAFEQQRNEAGGNAAAAHAVLERTPRHAQRAIYADGMLPPGQIHARSKRWAVKMFLSKYHELGYAIAFGGRCPKPYAIGILGHADEWNPPGFQEYLAQFIKPSRLTV